jgi:hypothetical protein
MAEEYLATWEFDSKTVLRSGWNKGVMPPRRILQKDENLANYTLIYEIPSKCQRIDTKILQLRVSGVWSPGQNKRIAPLPFFHRIEALAPEMDYS